MARTLKPATAATVADVAKALQHLKAARDLLNGTGSPMAVASVRSAIASTGSAYRHAQRRAASPSQPLES